MKWFLLSDVVLLTLLVLMSIANRHFDRKALMGSHANWQEIEGRHLEDVIVGQPVIPDQIYIFPFKRFFHDKIMLIYKPDNCLFHYPYIELHATEERVIDAVVDSPESQRQVYKRINLRNDDGNP